MARIAVAVTNLLKSEEKDILCMIFPFCWKSYVYEISLFKYVWQMRFPCQASFIGFNIVEFIWFYTPSPLLCIEKA